MKCELFEELIPLYVGGDLEPHEADDLRQHLNTCAHCRRLTEDFQASQNWLTGFAVPEFDEASFAKMRASVIFQIEAQIEQQEKRGRWIEWLLPKWSPRLMMASAAVALAIITALVATVYRQQLAPVKTDGEVIADGSDRNIAATGKNQPGTTIGGNQINAATDRKRVNSRSTRTDSTLLPPEAFTNDVSGQQPLEPPVIPEEQAAADPVPTTEAVEKDMLRIELQTADPNIRIIWLTPKEPGSPTKKPSA